MINFKREKDESKEHYIHKIYSSKQENNLTNKEVSEIINKELGTTCNESYLRGIHKNYGIGFDEGYEKGLTAGKSKKESESLSENIELKKELNTLRLENEHYKQIKSFKETTEIKSDGSYTSERLIGIENEDQLKDESFLLKVHGYDSELWTIVSARNSIWNAQLKGGAVTKMYASKINVKPRTDDISIEELKKHFYEFKNSYNKVYNNIVIDEAGDNMLVLPFNDLHFGKQSFLFDTGYEMNCEILEKRFFEVLSDIINQVKHIKFEKVIFPVGSDFYNSDTVDNTTTKGTKQDNAYRWQEMYKRGLDLLVKAIDYIQSELKCKIEVMYIMGNHDTMSAYKATLYLSAWYRNVESVEVCENGIPRKYIEYGKCLIGLTHGDKEGKRIYGLMQKEVPEAWGRTKYREFITGHIHHETVDSKDGVTIRTTPAICGVDFWHFESGYTGNVEKLQAFVYNKDKGLRNIIYGNFE